MDWHAPFLKVVYHIRNGFARPVCRIFAKFTRKIRHIRQALFSLRRIIKEKDAHSLLKPDAAAVFFLLLPLLSGFAEYAVNASSYLFSENYFSFSSGMRIVMLLLLFGAYLLSGLLLGFFTVQKRCSVSKWLPALILALSAVLWLVVVWGFSSPAMGWLYEINRISIYSSGAYFGFVMGASLRALCAKR